MLTAVALKAVVNLNSCIRYEYICWKLLQMLTVAANSNCYTCYKQLLELLQAAVTSSCNRCYKQLELLQAAVTAVTSSC